MAHMNLDWDFPGLDHFPVNRVVRFHESPLFCVVLFCCGFLSLYFLFSYFSAATCISFGVSDRFPDGWRVG